MQQFIVQKRMCYVCIKLYFLYTLVLNMDNGSQGFFFPHGMSALISLENGGLMPPKAHPI
jgi:hypothetical protein